jgi:hypothetical protein
VYRAYGARCDEEGIRRPLSPAAVLGAVREHARERCVEVEERKVRGGFELCGIGLAAEPPSTSQGASPRVSGRPGAQAGVCAALARLIGSADGTPG